MTVQEFSVEFDILLNQRYPGNGLNNFIDEYEKSILLTKAQEEVVKEYYSIYETNEKARRVLAPLVRSKTVGYDSSFNATYEAIKIDVLSKLFKLPSDVRFILTEQVLETVGTRHSVKPVTTDEYEDTKKNPFRLSTSSKAWDRALRLDLSYIDGGEQLVEIIYPMTIANYKLRYIKYPKPIILEDVFPDNRFDSYYYDIRELSTETTSELDIIAHEEILNKAVDLAAKVLSINK